MGRFAKSLRWPTLAIAGVFWIALLASLVVRFKLQAPEGVEVWLDSGCVAYVTPSGRFAELTANSASWGLTGKPDANWKYWNPLSLRPYRSGTWIQSFLWIPLTPYVAGSTFISLACFLVRRAGRKGSCPRCGYERTGLGASAVCPECGQTPA